MIAMSIENQDLISLLMNGPNTENHSPRASENDPTSPGGVISSTDGAIVNKELPIANEAEKDSILSTVSTLLQQILSFHVHSSAVDESHFVSDPILQSLMEDIRSYQHVWHVNMDEIINTILTNLYSSNFNDVNVSIDDWKEIDPVQERSWYDDEHFVEIDDNNEVHLVCCSNWIEEQRKTVTSSSSDDSNDVSFRTLFQEVVAVSYEWKKIENTSFEWQGGKLSCRHCDFRGGNPMKGGFNPKCLGKGTYWIDHCCCEVSSSYPLSSTVGDSSEESSLSRRRITTIEKSFLFYYFCQHLVVIGSEKLERNVLCLSRFWLDYKKKKEQNELTNNDGSNNDAMKVLDSHWFSSFNDIPFMNRGWIIWETLSSCDITPSFIILKKSINEAALLSLRNDKIQWNATFQKNSGYSLFTLPYHNLPAISVLLTPSYEATAVKVFYGSYLSASTTKPSNTGENQLFHFSQRMKHFNVLFSDEHYDNVDCFLMETLISTLINRILSSGEMFDFFDLLYASKKLFSYSFLRLFAFLLSKCDKNCRYLEESEERDAFLAVNEFSWFPPLDIFSLANEKEEEKLEIHVQLSSDHSKQCVLLSKILHVLTPSTVMDEEAVVLQQTLFSALTIRGFAAALLKNHSVYGVFPILLGHSFTNDNEFCSVEVCFCLNLVDGMFFFPYKLIWELEVFSNDDTSVSERERSKTETIASEEEYRKKSQSAERLRQPSHDISKESDQTSNFKVLKVKSEKWTKLTRVFLTVDSSNVELQRNFIGGVVSGKKLSEEKEKVLLPAFQNYFWKESIDFVWQPIHEWTQSNDCYDEINLKCPYIV
jgi:hypothetical protein